MNSSKDYLANTQMINYRDNVSDISTFTSAACSLRTLCALSIGLQPASDLSGYRFYLTRA